MRIGFLVAQEEQGQNDNPNKAWLSQVQFYLKNEREKELKTKIDLHRVFKTV